MGFPIFYDLNSVFRIQNLLIKFANKDKITQIID